MRRHYSFCANPKQVSLYGLAFCSPLCKHGLSPFGWCLSVNVSCFATIIKLGKHTHMPAELVTYSFPIPAIESRPICYGIGMAKLEEIHFLPKLPVDLDKLLGAKHARLTQRPLLGDLSYAWTYIMDAGMCVCICVRMCACVYP